MNQNQCHVCNCIVPPHVHVFVSAFAYFHKTHISWHLIGRPDLRSYIWCACTISALTGRRFNAGHYYATELYKQGHHLSVLQSSLSGIIEYLLFKPFYSSFCTSSPPVPAFSLCMPNHSSLCFDLKRGASYHALHVCQARAMRSN